MVKPAYNIILAEDHVRFREAIKKIIDEIPGITVMGEVGEGDELFELLETTQPDLILLDISMPNLRAMKATQAIKAGYPNVKVIIMVMDGENEYVAHAMAAGADGLLLKQNAATDLRTAIFRMRQGGRYFPKFLEKYKLSSNTPKFNSVGLLTFLTFC